jgi:F-type H+-transporting ATPase subunit delta
MKSPIIVRRYADAYLSYVRMTIGKARGLEDLHNLRHVLQNNPEFGRFLVNPEFGFKEKCGVIDKVLRYGYFAFETRDFVKLLIEKNRIEYLEEICEYVRVTFEHEGATEALLKTSYPLETETIRELKDALERRLHKKLNLYIELDPDLLGGVQVRVGNTVIDGSVQRRLAELKEKLMTAEVE